MNTDDKLIELDRKFAQTMREALERSARTSESGWVTDET